MVLTLVTAGAVSAFQVPVSLFPAVTFPRLAVSLDAGDRPADRMVLDVTWPVEESIRALPGVRGIRSTTSRGSAEIFVDFQWGRDMTSALLQAESAINLISSSLPPGTSYGLRRMDPTVFPVAAYSLTSSQRSLVELRDIARYQVRPFLSSITGAGRIDVLGGKQEEFQVVVDPRRMAAYNLTLDDIARNVSASNVLQAVGRLEDHYKLYLLVSDSSFKTLEQIQDTIVYSGKDGVIFLQDVADVHPGSTPQWTRVSADGRDAVLFQVYQQPDGNTIQISSDVQARLAQLKPRLPADVQIANWYDQSDLILASAVSVRDATLIGVALAALVLFLFLRDLRITLLVIVAVPSVLIATILMIRLAGLSFNIMTLGGMAAAVGLIVDDVIVMLEHIVRRAEESKSENVSVLSAAAEMTRPLLGSSASTIVIFSPLAFLSGVTGAFFKALSFTMASSLAISFLMAWVAVPLVVDLLPHRSTRSMDRQKLGWFSRLYQRIMMFLTGMPALILVPVALAGVVGWYGYRHSGSGFMPAIDEGGFVLDYRTPPGTSLTETDRVVLQVERILQSIPEVQTYSRRTGLQLGAGLTEANEGDFFVRLIPLPRRPIDAVIEEVRTRIIESVPGIEVEMAQLMEDLIGDLTAVPQPIEVKLYSDDLQLLRSLAPRVAEELSGIPGVVDVRDGIVVAGDAIHIIVDRVAAAREGLNVDSLTQSISTMLQGTVTTQIQRSQKLIGVRVWIPSSFRAIEKQLLRLKLPTPDGHLVPLGRVARMETVVGEVQIGRENLKQMIAVTGRISGRDLGSVIQDVRGRLGKAGLLPAGIQFELGGLYAEQQRAFRGLIVVFASAVLLVFLLLLFLYESFLAALTMMISTLLSFSAVFAGLWLTGIEINISSMMGMTMVVGIVTEVGIFYFSEFVGIYQEQPIRDALIQAGINRLRPIAMTTLAAILALTPLALAIGPGSAMQQPLAIAIISGLAVQLPIVLLVLPCLWLIAARFSRRYPAIRGQRAAAGKEG